MNASTLRFNGGTHNLINVMLAGAGRTEVTSTVNSTGAVTVANAATLANSATLGGAGAVTVNGTFEWNAGSVSGTGAFAASA